MDTSDLEKSESRANPHMAHKDTGDMIQTPNYPLQSVTLQIDDNEATPGRESSASVNAPGSYSDSKEVVVDPYYDSRKKDFYSARPGVLERAKDDIKGTCYNQTDDGEIQGIWLLLEVDHWDNETEKFVILTDRTLLSVRYDFVAMKVVKTKRVFLNDIDTVASGPFTYPKYSLCNIAPEFKRRACDGVRLMWNRGVTPTFLQNWNPRSESIPWQTFTYHPQYQTEEENRLMFDVKDFLSKITPAIESSIKTLGAGSDHTLIVKQEPLEQHIYVGLTSQVHNQSHIGMSMERGGVSF